MGDFTLIGSLTVGACVPIAVTANAALLPQLQAQVDGLIAAAAQLSVTMPGIEATLAAVAALQAAVQAAFALPSATLTLEAIAAIQAQLEASLAAILAINASLGVPGVYAYTYTGSAGDIIPGGIPDGGTTAHVNGIILLASDAGAWTAMKACFETGNAE